MPRSRRASPFLIGFRVAQAVSGAVVFPNGAGLIRELIPADRRGGAFGIVGGSIALAAGLGPLIGGVLVGVGGWRAIFLVNVPFVAAALALAWRAVPRTPGVVPETAFDWPGAALLAAVLGGSAALVVESAHAPFALAPGIPVLLVLAAVFIRRELRHPDPVFQPRFFKVRPFAAANAGISSSNLAFYTVLLATPILLTRHLDWSSLQVGVALAFLSAPMVVLSPIGGRLADRYGRRMPAVAGCVVLTGGDRSARDCARSRHLRASSLPPADGIRRRALDRRPAGLGDRGARARPRGVAAGLFSTSRYIGSFAGSIALARLLDEGEGLSGFHAVFVIALVGAIVSVLVTLALPRRRVVS